MEPQLAPSLQDPLVAGALPSAGIGIDAIAPTDRSQAGAVVAEWESGDGENPPAGPRERDFVDLRPVEERPEREVDSVLLDLQGDPFFIQLGPGAWQLDPH